MIPCDHVIAQLWEYLDGDLNGADAAHVQRHLDVCARCFPGYDFRRAYLEFMRRCSTETPPALRQRVFVSILVEQRVRPHMGVGPGGVWRRAKRTLHSILQRTRGETD